MSATSAEIFISELVIADIDRMLGNRLTPAERKELASRTIKIIDDYNRTVAIAAMERAKETMVEAAVVSAAKDHPNKN